MGAQVIYPSRSSARPVNPLVGDAFATAAGEVNSPFDYISEAVLPPLNMGFRDSGATGTIQRVKADELIQGGTLLPREPNAEIEAVAGVQLDPITFTLEEYSRQFGVPSIDVEDTQGIDLYGVNVANIWHSLKILQEARLDTFLMAGTWHPSDGNVSTKWDANGGDPIGDISEVCGFVPGANAIVMNRQVAFEIGKAANIRAYEPNDSRRHFVDPSALAAYLKGAFGLNLFISGARKSVSGTESYILRDSVWIGRVATGAIDLGPNGFRVNRHGAVRMAAQIQPTDNAGVRSSLLPSVAMDQMGNPMAGAPTLWQLEEWGTPSRRGKNASIGHREVLVQTSAVGGWVLGDVLT